MAAAWDKNAANASNDNAAAAAKRANNSRNLVLNEVIVQTWKSSQLYPTPRTCAQTSQSLDLLATVCAMESDTSGMSSTAAAAPSCDTLTLAQLYHPSCRLRHHGQKYTTPPPPLGGPAQDLSNFQLALIPILIVPTCSTSSPHDILKV
jgi:hypothetical protein